LVWPWRARLPAASRLRFPCRAWPQCVRTEQPYTWTCSNSFKNLPAAASQHSWRRPSNTYRQTGLYTTRARKERGLHALLFANQFQCRVTGHYGGMGIALDHGRYKRAFDQNAYGRSDLRRRFANQLLDQSAQKFAEALLVSADELAAGVGGIGQLDGGVLERAAAEPRRLEEILQGRKEGTQRALGLSGVSLH